jgi:hypothetical protein
VTFTKVLTAYLRFTLSIFLLYLSFPILGTVSAGFIVSFAHMNMKYFSHIHPPLPFPYALPSHWCHPLDRTHLSFLSFSLSFFLPSFFLEDIFVYDHYT